jgi:glycolate oxidase FAD binding subunit
MDNTEAAADWQASREQRLPFFDPPADGLCLWRLSVPQTAPVLDVAGSPYIEWQGAQRWLWAPAEAAAELRQAAKAVGGHASLFRASRLGDKDKSVGASAPRDAVQQGIGRELQKLFDPQGVFATGRLGL